jgi:flagellar protein FliO/FliZ
MDELLAGLRVLLSLGAVLALLWLAQRHLMRKGSVRGTVNLVTVVARQGIGHRAAVVVIQTGGQQLTLGVTEQSINVLHKEEMPTDTAAVPATSGSFAATLDAARNSVPASPVLTSRRDAHAGATGTAPSVLEGSILSTDTWRKAARALKIGRSS